MNELISDIFKTIGTPTITYVDRENGSLEASLNASLNEKGQLCLLSGPSKTGKTTLYTKVLSKRGEIPLIVRCDKNLRVDDIWRSALSSINFSQVKQRISKTGTKSQAEAELSGKFGWGWLANISAKIKGSICRSTSEEEIREYVLSNATPELIIPILKDTNLVLVIEDFHYLEDNEKILLFQQWKRFIDNEVSVLVLGTTHRAVDIANSNKDLIGRVRSIAIEQWSATDLVKIISQGFDHLKCEINRELKEYIATEAVGLPIIVQQCCLQIFESNALTNAVQARRNKKTFNREDVDTALHLTAVNRYGTFKSYYTTFIQGPREKTRKYATYELLIGSFKLDPIQFSLTRTEITQRIQKICSPEDVPPAASMNSTFGALNKFQERRSLRLLEWIPNEQTLYIIEPSFLFYVRWRTAKRKQHQQLDLFEELIIRISEGSKPTVISSTDLH